MVFIARRVRCMLPPCNFRIFVSYDKLSKKVRFKLAPNAMVKPVMYQTRRTYDSLLSYLKTVVFPSDLCYGHKKKRHILFSCMGLSNFEWPITSNDIEEKTKFQFSWILTFDFRQTIYRIFDISYMRDNLKYDNSIIVKKCFVSMQQHGAICL